ncbi:MAG: hypothetical protein V4469_02120 [Patescibacteria group bacterium]
MSLTPSPAPSGPVARQYLASIEFSIATFFALENFSPQDSGSTFASVCEIGFPSSGAMMTSFVRVAGIEMYACEIVIRNCGATFHVVSFDGVNFTSQELKRGETLILKMGCWFAFKSIHALDSFVCFTAPGRIEHDKDQSS